MAAFITSTLNVPHATSTVTSHDPVLTIDESDVVIDTNSIQSLDSDMNIYHGTYRGQAARFKEKRQLSCHASAGIDVRELLVDEAAIRIQVQTPDHVPVVGLVAASGGRILLVEAPYRYTALNEYLVAHPNADRRAMLVKVLGIVDGLHSRNLIHGSITAKSFVVDSVGNLCLSDFRHMRVQDPTVPFLPLPSPSIGDMASMSPELLQSLMTDGAESLTKASDVYAIGCLAYELLTGIKPFAKYRRSAHISQLRLITTVVDRSERPESPPADSNAYTRFGLTSDLWELITRCWAGNPASRPTVSELLQHEALSAVVWI